MIRTYSDPACAQRYAARLFSERTKPVKRAIDALIDTLPCGGSVLDIGCGVGNDIAYLQANSIYAVGVDISPAMLEIARGRSGGSSFVRCDFRDLSCFRPSSFDGILCLASLQHIYRTDFAAVFQQVARVLRRAGAMLIVTKAGHGVYFDKRLGEQFVRPTTLVAHEPLRSDLVRSDFVVTRSCSFALEREGLVDNWLAVLAKRA